MSGSTHALIQDIVIFVSLLFMFWVACLAFVSLWRDHDE